MQSERHTKLREWCLDTADVQLLELRSKLVIPSLLSFHRTDTTSFTCLHGQGQDFRLSIEIGQCEQFDNFIKSYCEYYFLSKASNTLLM